MTQGRALVAQPNLAAAALKLEHRYRSITARTSATRVCAPHPRTRARDTRGYAPHPRTRARDTRGCAPHPRTRSERHASAHPRVPGCTPDPRGDAPRIPGCTPDPREDPARLPRRAAPPAAGARADAVQGRDPHERRDPMIFHFRHALEHHRSMNYRERHAHEDRAPDNYRVPCRSGRFWDIQRARVLFHNLAAGIIKLRQVEQSSLQDGLITLASCPQ